MRCASPPDSVPDARQREIPQADIVQERRRSRISFRMRVAISDCCFVKVFGTSANHSLAP
jgi:hypothetical protein